MAMLLGFCYGLLYIVLSSFSDTWINAYHESVETHGLHYIAWALGKIAASQIGGPLMDFIFKKLKNRSNGGTAPEYHIPILLPGALLTPTGLFIYGWCIHYRVFWLIVDIGVFVTCFGMQIGGQAIQAYMIDAYPDHTSSATAASQFIRSLTAFAFSLFAPKLYSAFGYGWGNCMLDFIPPGIVVPAPVLIWFFGAKLRAKAQSSY